MHDVIVVGGGIAALELGAMLAHGGLSVAVFEKSGLPGGRALIQQRDGFVVDNGVHVIRFGPHSALSAICRHLGHHLDFRPMGRSRLHSSSSGRCLTNSPAVEGAIAWKRVSKLGVVDGTEVNVDQGRANRLPYHLPTIKDLFFVGDTTAAPGAGGDIGHESALGCHHTMKSCWP